MLAPIVPFFEAMDSPAFRSALIEPCLRDAFRSEFPFDHMYNGAGKVLTELLVHYDLVDQGGSCVRLKRSIEETATRIGRGGKDDDITLLDLFDCVLCYSAQFLNVPNVYDPVDATRFHPSIAIILRRAELLTSTGAPRREFIPLLLDHFMIVPQHQSVPPKERWSARLHGQPDPSEGLSKRFHPVADAILYEVSERTRDEFVEEIRSALTQSKIHPSVLPWRVASKWRYGERVPERRMWVPQSSLFLSGEVMRRLAPKFGPH